jgi:hypothetical protein
VGEIPGGAGGFYATHPNAAGVNPVGQNELNTMGHYDANSDAAWLAARMPQPTGGSPVDINAVAKAVLDQMAARLTA